MRTPIQVSATHPIVTSTSGKPADGNHANPDLHTFARHIKMTSQRIAPAAVVGLKRALTSVYWYKTDLRSFLTSALNDPLILARINWSDIKRDIVTNVVDRMASNPRQYSDDLIDLMIEVAKIDDFGHLTRLEDGPAKAREAKEAVIALRNLVGTHATILRDRDKTEERQAAARKRATANAGVQEKLKELRTQYISLLSSDHQGRGYILENILTELFGLFDLDPRASFRVTGEQIDGAFTFESTDYLFEGKWHAEPIGAVDLDALSGKLSRKLDNALGLFLSINGFSKHGLAAYSSGGRRLVLLMDGADLMAVLEDRIKLPELLRRKRRHASQTGNIFFCVADILAGRS
jgi:hypothetical protein